MGIITENMSLRVGMAQLDPTVGSFRENVGQILGFIARAKEWGIELLSFPELALCGYPPEDLLLKPSFIQANKEYLKQVVEATKDMTVVVGFAEGEGKYVYNAAAIIHDRELVGTYRKMFLPNYGVFDEQRYFHPGDEYLVFVLNGTLIGVNICEDIWYPEGPAQVQALGAGAEVIVNISASPYHAAKRVVREQMLRTRAMENRALVCYNNLVGGQDELVFDGAGMIFDHQGNLIAQGNQFAEDLIIAELNGDIVRKDRAEDPSFIEKKLTFHAPEYKIRRIELPKLHPREKPPLPEQKTKPLGALEEVYSALVLGTRDYVQKNGFQKVVIGLSGGIDSSLTAVIAVDALGRENVIGVSMPSVYSSDETQWDAGRLAQNLEIRLITIPINEAFQAYLRMFEEEFRGLEPDVTEENLQARIRGNILMALSNKFGWLVLSTGNKSETSVGYCTLYGDMAGGFAVIKDVPKTLVYELAQYRNSIGPGRVIPESVLQRTPSAELRPDQKDEDTLPPYSVLDPIMEAYVENNKSFQEIIALGYAPETVQRVIQMVDRNEYKRRQAPPGIKITPRAFGKDWRLPITNKYREF